MKHTPQKIILCRTRGDGNGDDEIVQMHWTVHSTSTAEMLARDFAEKNGWTIHFYGILDMKALEKSAEEHKETIK